MVAVAGPSGKAKSAVAAALVRLLRDAGTKPVLVVDADPGTRLAGLLGVPAGTLISEMLDEVVNTEGTAKERLVEQRLQQDCIAEGRGFDLITMGRPGGLEAHCYLRSVFHGVVARFKANYRAVVVDCDEGFEFAHGMGADDIDRLVVVDDPAPAASGALARAAELAVAVRRRVLVSRGTDAVPAGFDEAVCVPGDTRTPDSCAALRSVLV